MFELFKTSLHRRVRSKGYPLPTKMPLATCRLKFLQQQLPTTQNCMPCQESTNEMGIHRAPGHCESSLLPRVTPPQSLPPIVTIYSKGEKFPNGAEIPSEAGLPTVPFYLAHTRLRRPGHGSSRKMAVCEGPTEYLPAHSSLHALHQGQSLKKQE